MKIKDFQLKIAAALNTVEALVQGGCKALAEDLLTVSDGAIQTTAARAMMSAIRAAARKAG